MTKKSRPQINIMNAKIPSTLVEHNTINAGYVLSFVTYQRLVRASGCSRLLTLYLFYAFNEGDGKTGAWATNEYVAKGLKWNVSTVKKYRRKLIEMGFIEPYVSRDET